MFTKRLVLGSISLCALVACSKSSSSSAVNATPSASSVSSSVGDATTSSDASASTDGGSSASGETYLGAVGGLPVHATLTVTDAAITGRWFYEKGGGAEGLAIDASMHGDQKNHYVGTERIADGGTSGDLSLEHRGTAILGSWSKHSAEKTLMVVLAPEVRSRVGDHVVKSRRVTIKSDTPGTTASAGFLPVVEGPEAARIMPNLTFKALIGDDETELVGGTITALDFEVVLDDARLLTIAITEDTMGAYPSSNVLTDSFDWTTGKKIGGEAFAADKKAKLVKLLDKRVHDAWKAKKAELLKTKPQPNECGPDIAKESMDGNGPSFTAAMLDGVSATKDGVTFDFDFGFPHVIQACSPEVDLSLPWADVKAFVDPKGPFGGR
ncbi:MAG TPA: hypothetical protein VF407_19700 [Polyangiaceae bacterium]